MAVDRSEAPRRTARRPRYRKVARPVREQQILAVAGRMFATRGYQATSMEEIADGVGVSKPMLYRYFGSKDGLYLAYIRGAGVGLLESMRRAASETLPPEERLWAGIVAFFGFVDERREGWSVLYREAATQGGPFADEVARLRVEIARIVARLLVEAAPPGSEPGGSAGLEPLSHALVGAGESLANWWLAHPDERRDVMASRLMSFLSLGLDDLIAGKTWTPASRRDVG
jgi:AcrR family transcriptional regulator